MPMTDNLSYLSMSNNYVTNVSSLSFFFIMLRCDVPLMPEPHPSIVSVLLVLNNGNLVCICLGFDQG